MKRILFLSLGFLAVFFILTKWAPRNLQQTPGGKGETQSLTTSQDFKNNPLSKDQGSLIVWVIVPENCRSCQTGAIVDQLRVLFPGLQVQYLGSQESQALAMIKMFQIRMLPAYVFSKGIEMADNFSQVSSATTFVKDRYYLDPAFAGVSYFWGRMPEPQKIDLFVFLTHPDTLPILKMMKELSKRENEIKFSMHFVGARNVEQGVMLSAAGPAEAVEDSLYACIEKHFPKQSWDYLMCRLSDPTRLWLDDCLSQNNINKERIKNCLGSPEGGQLLNEKFKLSRELDVSYAPLMVLDNVEIFGVNPRTTADEILGILGPSKIKTANKKAETAQ